MTQTRQTAATMQIGDVAERTGLSLRTIRHYEEVGVLDEAERSPGGFRLYGEDAVERLLLVKQMKPLDFTLDEMKDLIRLRERLAAPRLSVRTRSSLAAELTAYLVLIEDRLGRLRRDVEHAEAFAAQVREALG